MKQVDLNNSIHNWTKLNIVTIMSKQGGYDELQCTICKIKGKRYGVDDHLLVPDNTSAIHIARCLITNDIFIGKSIKIANFHGSGPSFANLTQGSIHEIITPVEGYVNGDSGVWVMGVGEPVRVFFTECQILESSDIKMIRTKFKK